jgi:hypothetical protein
MEASDQLHAPVALLPRKKPGTNSIGSWVGLRNDLEVVEKRKTLLLPGPEPCNVQLVEHHGPIHSDRRP